MLLLLTLRLCEHELRDKQIADSISPIDEIDDDSACFGSNAEFIYALQPLEDSSLRTALENRICSNTYSKLPSNPSRIESGSREYHRALASLLDHHHSSTARSAERAFYENLEAYHLGLELYSATDTDWLSHDTIPSALLSAQHSVLELHLTSATYVFGNGLSTYWGARALAFWMRFGFKIRCKAYYDHREQDRLNFFSSFLPSAIGFGAQSNASSSTASTVVALFPMIDAKKAHASSLPHATSLLLLYLNPPFQRVMHHESVQAMLAYYAHNARNASVAQMDAMRETNDVVIHIRCGDVLRLLPSMRGKDWEYGFLTLAHYKWVLRTGLESKFGIDWAARITERTTVWVLSQLTEKAARKGDVSSIAGCDYLVHYVVEHGLQPLLSPAQVRIVYESDQNDDFYRMLRAPLLFCSPSTFCFNAAIANVEGIVVIPNRGAWIDLIAAGVTRNQLDAHNVSASAELIPDNQLIVDTMRNGWHCNYLETKTRDTAKFARELAQYLVTH